MEKSVFERKRVKGPRPSAWKEPTSENRAGRGRGDRRAGGCFPGARSGPSPVLT